VDATQRRRDVVSDPILKDLPVELRVEEDQWGRTRHTYLLHGNLLTGVTTITSLLPKPWLGGWMVKQAMQYVEDNYSPGLPLKPLLEKAKRAYRDTSSAALEIGTDVHEWIKAYVKFRMHQSPTAPPPLKEGPARQAVNAFLEWETVNAVVWYYSEKIVASETHAFAGTMDFLARVNGKIMLGDFKTSKSIYPQEHGLQTAAYQLCAEEMGGEVEGRMIVRLPKVEGDRLEARALTSDVKFDQRAFLHLRELHRWNLYHESLKKEA